MATSIKKDFGLGKHRITLPESEENGSTSGNSTPETKNKAKNSPLPFRVPGMSSITGRVKSFLSKSVTKGTQDSPAELRGSPLPNEKAFKDELLIDLADSDSNGKQSPVLHSRVVQKGHLGTEGVKGSLENLIDTYGLTDDGTVETEELDKPFIKLLLKSGNNDHQVTLQNNDEGLAIRLSSGQSPVYVTQVEPDSEADMVGIKVDDIVLEVNGKDCRAMEGIEITRILQLKTLIKNSPNQARGMKESLTLTSIDSESDNDDLFTGDKLGQQDEDSSLDESMFELSGKAKSEFKPILAALKEEKSIASDQLLIEISTPEDENIRKKPKEGIPISRSVDDRMYMNTPSKTNNSQSERSDLRRSTMNNALSIPLLVTSDEDHSNDSKSRDFQPSTPKKSNSSTNFEPDFLAIPSAGEKLGVEVGRYKRDIGPRNRRKRHSLKHTEKNSIFTDQSKEAEGEGKKRNRTSSASSFIDMKPTPKEKPPVAMKRKSSKKGEISSQETTPSIVEEVTPRRYTTPIGHGHLLAVQAASARGKLRSSTKLNEKRKSTEVCEISDKEGSPLKTSASSNSLKDENKNDSKQDDSGMKAVAQGEESSSKMYYTGIKGFESRSLVEATDRAESTPERDKPARTVSKNPPPKPPRLRERLKYFEGDEERKLLKQADKELKTNQEQIDGDTKLAQLKENSAKTPHTLRDSKADAVEMSPVNEHLNPKKPVPLPRKCNQSKDKPDVIKPNETPTSKREKPQLFIQKSPEIKAESYSESKDKTGTGEKMPIPSVRSNNIRSKMAIFENMNTK